MVIYKKIMTDVETFSTRTNGVIVSIGSAYFDFENLEVIDTFYVNLNPYEGKAMGLHIDPNTIDFWKNQKPEALKALSINPVSYKEGIEKYIEWCGQCKDVEFWSQGTDFDYSILKWSMETCGLQHPWKYNMLRDTRTAFSLAEFDYINRPRVGTFHNALDDVLTQIHWLQEALK